MSSWKDDYVDNETIRYSNVKRNDIDIRDVLEYIQNYKENEMIIEYAFERPLEDIKNASDERKEQLRNLLKLQRNINMNYNHSQIEQIICGYEHGLSPEAIQKYADHRFSSWQMGEIRTGLECGLSMSQVETYADWKFASLQMYEAKLGFIHNLSIEQVVFLLDNSSINPYNAEDIRLAFEDGYSIDDLADEYGTLRDNGIDEEMDIDESEYDL